MHPGRMQSLQAYVQAWSEPDLKIAKDLLNNSLTEDIEILGPNYKIEGKQAVLAEIERFHLEQSGWKVLRTSVYQTQGRWSRFAIATVNPAGEIQMEGLDLVEQDTDGKITQVITFWGPLPHEDRDLHS